VAYKVFIFSVAPDFSLHNINGLSNVSNEVTLTTTCDVANSVQASDVADNKNGLDLQVTFDKATDETTISEYRIMVLKSANAAAFDLSSAEAVIADNYTTVAPTGNNISTVLTDASKDVDGDAIVNDIAYKVFVLSIADGTNANLNNLSTESNEVTLTTTSEGISEIDIVSNIYPNPVADILNIELQDVGNYTVKIMDLSGKIIFDKMFEGNSTSINVSQLESANYILVISNKETTVSKKIIVK